MCLLCFISSNDRHIPVTQQRAHSLERPHRRLTDPSTTATAIATRCATHPQRTTPHCPVRNRANRHATKVREANGVACSESAAAETRRRSRRQSSLTAPRPLSQSAAVAPPSRALQLCLPLLHHPDAAAPRRRAAARPSRLPPRAAEPPLAVIHRQAAKVTAPLLAVVMADQCAV